MILYILYYKNIFRILPKQFLYFYDFFLQYNDKNKPFSISGNENLALTVNGILKSTFIDTSAKSLSTEKKERKNW